MTNISAESKQRAIDILTKHTDSKLLTHLNACVHCGLCETSCLFWKTFKDPKFIPGKKVDMVSSIYRRYCTFLGARLRNSTMPRNSPRNMWPRWWTPFSGPAPCADAA